MNPETVTIPQEHAGVGAALRAAFQQRVPTLPNELAVLIDKLR
ncbi:hypothetical protein [Sphingomonas solaris]|nr:hypothetical protein [Sphingomonas solaris]